jgi:ABC-type taurine transport system ATPase subunit
VYNVTCVSFKVIITPRSHSSRPNIVLSSEESAYFMGLTESLSYFSKVFANAERRNGVRVATQRLSKSTAAATKKDLSVQLSGGQRQCDGLAWAGRSPIRESFSPARTREGKHKRNAQG